MRRATGLILIAVIVAGCGRSKAPAGNVDPRPTASDGPAAADADPQAPVADAPPPPRPDQAAAVGQRGDRCQGDDGCGWDDPCMPTRCGAVTAPAAVKCDETAPPPGTCTCVESQCALRPTDASRGASAPGCTGDADCAIDVGRATCVLRGTTLIGPITEQGPVCTCAAGGRCEWSWSGPVPCTTWRDCSWVTAPRLRPVPSTVVPRPVDRPVRPCQDGERDSVCTPARVCRVVSWGC